MNNSSQVCPGKPDNFTMFNGTDQFVSHITAYFIHAQPIMVAVGLPGAILSFLVWIRKPMRQSSSIYLAALALFDTFFFIHLLIFYLHQFWNARLLDVPVYCQVFPVIYYFLQYMSPIMTLGFTVERYISICFPFQRERLCSKSRAWKITLILSVIGFSTASVQAIFVTFNNDKNQCVENDVFLKQDTWQSKFLLVWSILTEMLIFGAVPIAILIFNIFVIKEMHRISLHEPRLPASIPAHEKKISNGNGPAGQNRSGPAATTFMLLTVSFYVLLACLPSSIMQIVFILYKPGSPCLYEHEVWADAQWRAVLTVNIIRSMFNSVAVSHFAVKFYIYVATGKLFRKQLVLLFQPFLPCCSEQIKFYADDNFRDSTNTFNAPQRRRPNRYSQLNLNKTDDEKFESFALTKVNYEQ